MRLIWMAIAVVTGVLGARTANANPLNVVVDGLEKKGRVLIMVVDRAAAWDGEAESLVSINAKVNASKMTFRVDVPTGPVAIRLFHDENGNGKLDTNMLGIPTEGYGFSTNPSIMGPATFEDAVFRVSGKSTSTTIKVE